MACMCNNCGTGHECGSAPYKCEGCGIILNAAAKVMQMSDPCYGCTRPQCHDDNMSADDTNKISQYVQSHAGGRFCMVDITDC